MDRPSASLARRSTARVAGESMSPAATMMSTSLGTGGSVYRLCSAWRSEKIQRCAIPLFSLYPVDPFDCQKVETVADTLDPRAFAQQAPRTTPDVQLPCPAVFDMEQETAMMLQQQPDQLVTRSSRHQLTFSSGARANSAATSARCACASLHRRHRHCEAKRTMPRCGYRRRFLRMCMSWLVP